MVVAANVMGMLADEDEEQKIEEANEEREYEEQRAFEDEEAERHQDVDPDYASRPLATLKEVLKTVLCLGIIISGISFLVYTLKI